MCAVGKVSVGRYQRWTNPIYAHIAEMEDHGIRESKLIELVALCAEGMTILMVEHELAIMDEFCDPVVVMAEGRVLAEGTMEQLRGRSEVVEAYLVG